jgi:hypothetical protein
VHDDQPNIEPTQADYDMEVEASENDNSYDDESLPCMHFKHIQDRET